jgi:hypothetical protein
MNDGDAKSLGRPSRRAAHADDQGQRVRAEHGAQAPSVWCRWRRLARRPLGGHLEVLGGVDLRQVDHSMARHVAISQKNARQAWSALRLLLRLGVPVLAISPTTISAAAACACF